MENVKRKMIKSFVALLLMTAMLIPQGIYSRNNAEAAVVYISVQSFAKSLAKELGIKPASGTKNIDYVNALKEKGIIKDGDFSSYSSHLKRTDAAVLLNRADEYLYGDTLDPKLVKLALEKRISDISSIKASKREDVVKCYLKGYIKGYSNGDYSTDRTFKGSKKISKAGALECIKMLKNKSMRAKISPDGQLIRTTNLPVYAKYYPYILASYPNTYYDWKFYYEEVTVYEEGKKVQLKNTIDYAAPVDVDKTKTYENFAEIKEEYLPIWTEKVKTYLECVFNVDYRSINKDWIDKVMSTDYTYGYISEERTRKWLESYINNMKSNKTIVECDKVAVDSSTLYFFNGAYYLRVYVHYRIVSSNIKHGVDRNTLADEWTYNKILWTTNMVNLTKYKLGEWKDAYFDIELSYYDDLQPENRGVAGANLNEYYYTEGRITKK